MNFTAVSFLQDSRSALLRLIAGSAAFVAAAGFAPAQSAETVLHRFRGGADGANPIAGLISDANGALYGTTTVGGSGFGTVFKLTPPVPPATSWTKTVLHSFRDSGTDGAGPWAGLTFDASGALYGTTIGSGTANEGTVFKLTPPAAGQTRWTETILYSFKGPPDAGQSVSRLTFDANGALYGATGLGGGGTGCSGGCGAVFKLTPPAPGHTRWTETVLYR